MLLRSRQRRVIAWIGLSLLAGAGVNVLIAFRGGAIRGLPSQEVHLSRAEAEALWHQYVGPIELGGEVQAYRYDRWIASLTMLHTWESDATGYRYAGCRIFRAGWPMGTAQGEHHETREWSNDPFTPGRTRTRAEGIFTVPRRIGPIRAGQLIPIRPIWTGMVVNSLFYALALAAASFVVRHTRRRARLGRRLCAECKYDLRGSMTDTGARCPECGSEYPPAQLSVPRSLVRWWMVPLLLPLMAMVAYWGSGMTDWISLRYHFRWVEPIFTPRSFSYVVVLGFFVYQLGLWSYQDRPTGRRHAYAAAVALLLTPTSYASAFILIVRLSAS